MLQREKSLMTVIWDLFGMKKATFQHFFEFSPFWAKQYKRAAERCYCIFSYQENGFCAAHFK